MASCSVGYPYLWSFWRPWLVFWVLAVSRRGQNVVSGSTLRDLIVNYDNLSLFRTCVSKLGILEKELDDPDRQFTLLAPTNEAIEANTYFKLYMTGIDENPLRWKEHLLRLVRNHMVENVALTNDQIYDGTRANLFSMEDPLRISTGFRNVEGAQIVDFNMMALNGVLHVIDRVMEPELCQHSLEKLEIQGEFGPDWLDRVSLHTIVEFNDARSYYNHIIEEGQTQVGCRIRALNRIGLFYLPKTINRSPEIKFGEFLNASNREETIHDLIEYSLIHKNYYHDTLSPGQYEWIMAANGCSHILVTKSHSGQLCFNDGCVVATPRPRTFLSSNGVGHVVDKCIVCSGVAMLLEYTANFRPDNANLKDSAQFWETSEWNPRNLSMSVGNGDKITLIAAQDHSFSLFNAEDVARISTDKWKVHQWNFLLHNMLQGVYYEQDFIDMWYNNSKSAYNMTALSGEEILFDYDEARGKMLVHGNDGVGEFLFTNIKGVDGVLHFVGALPVPRSVTHTVYDIAKEDPNYLTQITLIDTVFLQQDLKRLLPITGCYAPNEDWANKVIELEDISKSVLENMIFAELQWCASLRKMVGERLESHNGQTWRVSINETTNMPCFDTIQVYGGPVRRSCITKCDILARNGIVHYLDHALFFEDPETTGPQPPAIPTYINPAAPTFYQPPSPPVPGWYLARPTFYGPINPAYAARGEEGHGDTSGAATARLGLSVLAMSLVVFWGAVL